VGVREWVGGKLSWLGASTSAPDPDEMCDLLRVPVYEAPILVTRLKAQGIPAEFEDPNPLSMSPESTRILVRRRDLDAAQAVYMSGKSDDPEPSE
jgi:hypothetical protein